MNIIDRIIEPFSPSMAARRTRDRLRLKALKRLDFQNSGYDRHGASKQKKPARVD